MTKRTHMTQAGAAAVAGFSERTAREIDKDPTPPSQRQMPRHWRTREDSLAGFWARAEELLRADKGIMPVTVFESLQDELGPEVVPDSVRRSLERRVASWKALHGEDKEVFFPQRHEPGRQGLSDFTVADELGVTIAGEAFPHRLYHFRLAYSGWEHMRVVLGGESFSALSEGLQEALWKLGKAPVEHRSDSLSAAYKNLARDAQADFTKRYEELCQHYGMAASRNNPGEGHENGSIESPNRHMKRRLDQELRKRGNRDFESVDAYRRFVATICDRHNRRRGERIAEEIAKLRDLPARRTADFAKVSAPVTRNATISVDRVLYTVPPRLIGRTLDIHLFDDRLECFLGPDAVAAMPRVRVGRCERGHQINFRHVIGTLRKKPQALRNLIYRDALFPHTAFARAWAAIDAQMAPKPACRLMVDLLDLAAAQVCEKALAERLDTILDAGQLPDLAAMKAEFAPKTAALTADVTIPPPDIAGYDALLPFMPGAMEVHP